MIAPDGFPYPSRAVLENRLSRLLAGERGGVQVVSRVANELASRSLSEIVTCRFPNGTTGRVFCKYSSKNGFGRWDERGSDRGQSDPVPPNAGCEVTTYRRLVEPSGFPAPRFLGGWSYPDGRSWLVIEFIEDGTWLLEDVDQERGLELAASWIGAFHKSSEKRLRNDGLDFLDRYDPLRYRGRLERFGRARGHLAAREPWLATLLFRFDEVIHLLRRARPTVVHGDYYPANILRRNGTVYPVDWETAAVGPGELDLAALTDGWPREVAAACEAIYRDARYGSSPPADFGHTLAAARAYLNVRWLGEPPDPRRPEWTERTSGDWRLKELRAAAEELGLAG